MLSSSVWRARSQWWFATGSVLGGLTTALLALSAGSLLLRPLLPDWVSWVVMVGATGLILMREAGWIRLPLPQNGRQVPQAIALDGPRYGPLHFGYEMGTGLRTYMTSGLPHVLVLAIALVAPWQGALVAGAAFGAGRAAMLLARTAHRSDADWDQVLARRETALRVISAGASVVLAVALAVQSGAIA